MVLPLKENQLIQSEKLWEATLEKGLVKTALLKWQPWIAAKNYNVVKGVG